MYKFLSALFIAAALSTTAFGQTKGTTQFGLHVGLNGSNVTTGNISNDEYRTGINAGVSVEHYFSDSWSFKTRLIYDQRVGIRATYQMEVKPL